MSYNGSLGENSGEKLRDFGSMHGTHTLNKAIDQKVLIEEEIFDNGLHRLNKKKKKT